jgi:DNA-binding transcriptional LysR family regulator
MQLDSLRIFVKVAELASFTRAAEQLGMGKTRVSNDIAQLETQLGTRLLHRTTRAVTTTQDGTQFLERCKELLANADDLQTLFRASPGALKGRLRLDLPVSIARNIVIPRLPEFLAAYPQLEIELSTTDRRVDLVNEGFDCVLRVGMLRDSDLVARRIGVLRMTNCASPAYLLQYGTPQSLEDLDRHRLIHYSPTLGAAPVGWEYRDSAQYRFRPMPGIITVNNSDAYQAACLAGLGIIQVPVLGVFGHAPEVVSDHGTSIHHDDNRSLIAQGLLVEVLPEFVAEPMPVSLVYPNRRNLSKRVQGLMDWLTEVLAPHLDYGE